MLHLLTLLRFSLQRLLADLSHKEMLIAAISDPAFMLEREPHGWRKRRRWIIETGFDSGRAQSIASTRL
jgi:hypothetical protein